MNEQLVALVVKGEVKVDQFVYVEVLETGQMGKSYVRDLVDGHKGTVVAGHLGKKQVDFVLKKQFVELHVYFKGFKQLLLFVFALNNLDKPAVRPFNDVLFLKYEIFQLHIAFLLKSLTPFPGLVEHLQFIHGQFIVNSALLF